MAKKKKNHPKSTRAQNCLKMQKALAEARRAARDLSAAVDAPLPLNLQSTQRHSDDELATPRSSEGSSHNHSPQEPASHQLTSYGSSSESRVSPARKRRNHGEPFGQILRPEPMSQELGSTAATSALVLVDVAPMDASWAVTAGDFRAAPGSCNFLNVVVLVPEGRTVAIVCEAHGEWVKSPANHVRGPCLYQAGTKQT